MIKYSRSVNYYETDQMGIVHHSNYIRYFEEARLHWMDEIGLSYSGLEELGVIIPVTFVDCRYKNPVRFGDTISISVRISKFDGTKPAPTPLKKHRISPSAATATLWPPSQAASPKGSTACRRI